MWEPISLSLEIRDYSYHGVFTFFFCDVDAVETAGPCVTKTPVLVK